MHPQRLGRALKGLDLTCTKRRWLELAHRLKQRAACGGAAVLLAAGVAACSPMAPLFTIRTAFDPPPRVALGPEDVERWVAEIGAETARSGSPCDRNCALRQMGYTEDIQFWRPSRAQVRRLEAELVRGLHQARKTYGGAIPPRPLSHYSVTYLGVIRRAGG
jgi:hypothetical protein